MKYAPLILALLAAPLAAAAEQDRAFTVVISQGVNLRESDILPLLPPKAPEGRTFEIVIYYYSAGVETLSYTGEEDATFIAGNGKLKALVKVRKNGKLRQALFLESAGPGRTVILKNFSIELNRVIPLY